MLVVQAAAAADALAMPLSKNAVTTTGRHPMCPTVCPRPGAVTSGAFGISCAAAVVAIASTARADNPSPDLPFRQSDIRRRSDND